jgi:outer membrane protein TolC
MNRALSAAMAAAILVSGCSTTGHKDGADREVYRLIEERGATVAGMPEEFSIEADAAWDPLAGLPVLETDNPALVEAGISETGAPVVGLEQALLIAVNRSRIYQDEKEALYLEGLALTLDQHRFSPRWAGRVLGDIDRDTETTLEASDATKMASSSRALAQAIEGVTGTPASLLRGYANVIESSSAALNLDEPRENIDEVRTASGQTQFGVDLLMKGGGALALGLTTNLLRFLTGDVDDIAGSVLAGSFTQPLLAGGGRLAAAENLTQAEQNFLYAVRRYTRFRKTFAVQVCSAYYGVLQQRDAMLNNYRNWQSFQRNTEREREFAAVGRSTAAMVGRQEQGLLSAEDQWSESVQRYQADIDNFKLLLGIPTDTPMVLDDNELVKLRERGLQHPDIAAEDAGKVAAVSRLDLHTARDAQADAERQVLVAANALKPGLDLIIQADLANSGRDNFADLDFERARWNAGFDLDLPLDRKAERNAYRAALINFERSRRETSLAEDTVQLEVREGWRNLDQARRNYETALKSVELNQRRVLEQELLAELGRGSVLDQVDAQNNLTEAENNLTAALVRHNIARLAFWRDMGILYIKPDGQWELVQDNLPTGGENDETES